MANYTQDYPKNEIAAVKGKKVVYIRYFGDAKTSDVEEQVEVFLKKFKSIDNFDVLKA